MNTIDRGVSSCRHCQFYKMEGRRGGFCHQLGVTVQGRWRACTFATPLFAALASPQLHSAEEIVPAAPVILPLQQVFELEPIERLELEAVAAETLLTETLLQESSESIAGVNAA